MPSSETSFISVTTDSRGRPKKLVVSAAALRCVGGRHSGERFSLDKSPVVLGSHRSSDIRLEDPTVSSRHAEIALRPSGYLLRDLGSRNGIRLGPWRVEEIYLSPGMIFALGRTTLEVIDLEQTVEVPLSPLEQFGLLDGRSLPMRQMFAQLEAAARTDATVLLEGETGTGKELTAESLHLASRRAAGPFVVFDCASVAPTLAESELFGHVRGAFTGADSDRSGALARADGGTLFLDEIGELEPDLQPKLLRATETHRYTPVGGSKTRPADVRIIAATHRNLEEEVRRGAFRKDLYFRLAVVRIRVPPLRERLDDLPQLIGRLAQELGRREVADRVLGLLPLLRSYSWPGNVRELRNVIERLSVLPVEDALPSVLLGRHQDAQQLVTFAEARERAVDQFERLYVTDLLATAGGNVTRAAELAGLSRRYLTRLITKHRLQRGGAPG
jgi:DNA-binding NtrC family response regulator